MKTADMEDKSNSNDDDEFEPRQRDATRIGAYCTLRSSSLQPDVARGRAAVSSESDETPGALPNYCTVSRKLRQIIKSHDDMPPYKKLKSGGVSAQASSSGGGAYDGISNNLSTESIRQACDCFEFSDESDDDLREVSRTPRRPLRKSNTMDRKRQVAAHPKSNPFCTLRRHKEPPPPTRPIADTLDAIDHPHHSSMTLNQEEAFHILNELDAILDNHALPSEAAAAAAASLVVAVERDEPEKVEDCLLELDTYLNEMDRFSSDDGIEAQVTSSSSTTGENIFARSKTLPRRFRQIGPPASGSEPLRRGHQFRNTIGSGAARGIAAGQARKETKCDMAELQCESDKLRSSPTNQQQRKQWRRNSMRKTSLLVLPEHQGSSNSCRPVELAEMPTSSQPTTVEERQTTVPEAAATTTTELRRALSHGEGLTQLDILQDIIQTHHQDPIAVERPRQLGRRADDTPRIVSILADNRRLIINHDRPMSAPAPVVRSQQYIGSEPSSVGSSRNPSPVSLLSSTGSSSIGSTGCAEEAAAVANAAIDVHHPRTSIDPENIYISPDQGMNAHWPHAFSRVLGILCCTLGLFNISRFAVQTIHYGGNFILQFLLLSIVFGIPMLWLQMCLGAKIKAGPISMWKISPICKGIGISLLLMQTIVALYSTVSLSWCLVYLRDSFLSKTHQHYNWQEPFYIYRRVTNISGNLTETVADYFNGIVLQRGHMGRMETGRRIESGGVRFQLAFNLALIWAAVFLILCKGLKSFGKIVLGLTVVPMLLLLVITCKLLYIIDFSSVQNIFSSADFEDFLVNSKTWTAAAQESFLTWAFLGSSILDMSSRSAGKNNSKYALRRDAILVVFLTLFGLSLAGMFGYACVQILQNYDYLYLPGSFETVDSSISLYSLKSAINPALISLPAKWAPHYSSVLGETYRRPQTGPIRESGYQSLRLVTELFPATVAVADDAISSPWTILTFLMFVLFGLAQLCAMWKPVSTILGNTTSSVLLSCVTALLLGMPFATEMGISVIHFLDLIIGGAWCILVLWTAHILGVFLIRGRPYNGDVLVNDLRMCGSMSAFLALSWNVLLPIGMIALAVIEYKISLSNQFFHWRGKAYFGYLPRKLGGLTQVGFLLLVPITAIVQIYRYLTTGPPDILDRIQLLYRPTDSPLPHRRTCPLNGHSASRPSSGATLANLESQLPQDDAPPKYTPPPSYTTATGARLAKILRQSIRRSVRRIMGEPSRPRPPIPTTSHINDGSLPPEYSTVLSHPSGACEQHENIEIGPRPLYNSYTQRTVSLGRRQRPATAAAVVPATVRPSSANAFTSLPPPPPASVEFLRPSQPFTANDVAHVLRSSSRQHHHQRSASAIANKVDNVLLRASTMRQKNSSRSAENLVLNVAPLGESNAIVLDHPARDARDENTSVI